MKEYPWINFSLDLRRISASDWIRLGQCVSKCRHLSRVPLLPEVARDLHMVYLTKGAQATTAIEGNTLTLEQVQGIAEGKYTAPPSKKYLEQEVRNILEACDVVATEVMAGEGSQITLEKLCQFNHLVLRDVPVEDGVIAGQLRQHSVVVGNVYRGPAARDVSELTQGFCEWMNGPKWNDASMDSFALHIIKAIVAHLYIAWIHPFGDGNGRTARLVEFNILLSCGIPSPAAHLLSNHYNATRDRYYRELDRAGKTGGDLTGFLSYAIEGLRDGLQEQLDQVYSQTNHVMYQHYVYDQFRKQRAGTTSKRRRDLAIEISAHNTSVTKRQLLSLMSEYYAGKTEKTLTQDINKLTGMKLIVADDEGFRSNLSVVTAFLPFAANPTTANE